MRYNIKMIIIEIKRVYQALQFFFDFPRWISEFLGNVQENDSKIYQDSCNKYQHVRNTTIPKAKRDILVAIDIGTENMGYAILFRQRKDHIYTAKYGTGRRTDREPTAVLFNADDSVNSIGYKAVDTYSTSAGNMSHSEYLLCRRFKRQLFESDRGDRERLEELIEHTVLGLKEKAITTIAIIKDCNKSHVENKIEWIITTPSLSRNLTNNIIIRGARKAFLRENVFRAYSEASSAACFCRNHQLQVLGNGTALMSIGDKYIVCDIGAGKIDTCVFEICGSSSLPEPLFHKFNPIGGHSVNENFVAFIKEIVGSSIWKEFLSDENYFDALQLLDQFEEKKMGFDKETEYIILTIPQPLLEIVDRNEIILKKLTEAGNETTRNIELTSRRKLLIKREKIEEFFQPSLNALLQDLREVRRIFTEQDLTKLVLVGGYSESAYIRQKIADDGLSFDIALMQDPQMAVLKGALLLGLED